ncbi:40506_t:CDS:2, partial [Gigaspora margarita]
KRELTHVKVDSFHRSDNENPIEWLEAFENWYKGKKGDLTQWKNEEEKESKLKQLKYEKVDLYTTKFKKLLKQVNLNNEIPNPYIIWMFLSEMQGKAATFVTMAELKDLDKAITKTRKAEASKYYSKQTFDKSYQRKVEEELENLLQKIEQITLKYAPEKSQKDGVKEPKRDIICFRCGEIGHIAQCCLSERKPKRESEKHQSTNYIGWFNPYDNGQET